jgi:hypothetical protein
MKRCGLRAQPRSHSHISESVRECEGMSPHTPKWTPLWVLESIQSLEFLESNFKGQNSLDWKAPCTIKFFLRHRCLKWAFMTHLITYNTSYGQKKGEESKCQFDSRPLKVKNHLELCACRWCATYYWKDLDKGYKFSLDFISIENLYKKLWGSEMPGVLILNISKLPTWKSQEKWHLDATHMAHQREYYKREGFPKFGSWWVLWVRVCSWLIRASKVLQLHTNQLVV